VDDVFSLAQDPVRLLRPAGFGNIISDLPAVNTSEMTVLADSGTPASKLNDQGLVEIKNRLSRLVDNVADTVEIGLCWTDLPVDAVQYEGKIIFNARMDSMVREAFWQTVLAREIAFSDQQLPAERRIQRIQELLSSL
jgi:hypothetical protein